MNRQNADTGSPWETNGPRLVTSILLSDIDDADTTFQFRFRSSVARLKKSLSSKGQLNPIKVMSGGHAYLVIDGFSRVAAARQLGWSQVRALVYPGISDREARRLSWECNIVRKNLSVDEKANAMLAVRQEGFSPREIAAVFGISMRQVNRYLELPEQLRAHVDGTTVTMAHVRVLKGCLEDMNPDELEQLLEWTRVTCASSRELKAKLKDGNQSEKRGRPRKIGRVQNGRVRGYAFDLGPHSPAADWERARAFAMALIREADRNERRNERNPEAPAARRRTGG